MVRWTRLVAGGVCCSLFGACGGEPSGDGDLAEARDKTVLINSTFDSSSEAFSYVDDTFGTSQPNAASGTASGGMLHVTLGQLFNVGAQSGGWRNTFTGGGPVTGSFFYRIAPSGAFESAECNEVRVTIDGTTYGSRVGTTTNPWAARVCGPATTQGTFNFTTNSLAAGTHTITIGGYLNGNTEAVETSTFDIDNVSVNGTRAFLESGGQVVMESENHTGYQPQGVHQWVQDTSSGSSGSAARRANPNNNGTNFDSNFLTASPRLDYLVNFTQVGTYHVWVRGRAVSGSSGSHSIHAGIDFNTTTSADKINGYTTTYSWRRTTADGPTASIAVNTPGLRTFNLWMRQDGFIVDKVVLTTNSSFTPTNGGPAESARLNVCSDGACNGAESCSTCAADCGPCTTCDNDQSCEAPGETCSNCPGDCGQCPVCDNDQNCEAPTETCSNCPGDCGQCPVCDNDQNCEAPAETCSNCPEDCGQCAWGLDERPANPTCVAPPPVVTGFRLARRWPSLMFSEPLGLTQAPGDNAWFYIVEKTGRIKRVSSNDAAATAPVFLDLSNVVDTQSEGGLLALAFHPNYATNRYFFVSYTDTVATGFTMFVSRFTASADGASVVSGSERIILAHPKLATNHNAGNIAFSPTDGFLYISLGDDAWQNPQRMLQAADPNNLFGKVLRINPSTATNPPTPAYTSPSSNPFFGGNGRPEVYAYGLRNPWRFSFDKLNGELWLADVGEDRWEEINRIELGGFYGWPHREADFCRTGNPGVSCTLPYESPEFAYVHGGALSITGGYVYRGSAIPELQGHYVYGDYITGDVWEYDVLSHVNRPIDEGGPFLSAFGEDNAGELYAIRITTGLANSGIVERLERTTGGGPTDFPALLTDTGCFTGTSQVPVTGAIPYSIALPFWSDGADKDRFVAIPDASQISIDSTGDWVLPPGGVTIKNFKWGGRLFETRFFVRHQNGSYSGYTYEWNDAMTQATLVPTAGKTRVVTPLMGTNNLDWWYPSRSGCFACHGDAAGRSLGLETRQLNVNHTYAPERTANQLVTLEHIGMLQGNLASMPPYPTSPSAPLLDRGKAYLHVNCSNCHQPGGAGRGPMDARFLTPFADMRLCNEPATFGSGMLFAPGSPSSSSIFTRINQRVDDFMPPLASGVVDSAGVSLLSQWITGTATCPTPPVLACDVGTNRLTNCNLANGTNNWFHRGNGGSATLSVVGGELRIDVTNPLAQNYQPQIVQPFGGLDPGASAATYQIEIWARAATPRTIVVNVGQDHDPWRSLSQEQVLQLSTTMTKFVRTFTVQPGLGDPNVKFDINVGGTGNTATVFVDNVYLGPVR